MNLTQESYEQLRAAHIARYLPDVTVATLDRLRELPNTRRWLDGNVAVAYFGPSQMARKVQVLGLMDAAASWGIPTLTVNLLAPRQLVQLTEHDEVVMFSHPPYLPVLAALRGSVRMRIAVVGPFYDAVPNPALAEPMDRDLIATLAAHRAQVSVVLSEFSPEGNERYCAGYCRDHGLPVMTFPWAANLMRHFPVDAPMERDAVFLGSYFEKPDRINRYLGDTIRHRSSTIVGPGWNESPFGVQSSRVEDFNRDAPALYSSHAVCLNVHHDYQECGHSCNERGFNTVACGGFQVSDPARRLRHYFLEDELVIADSPDDFTDKVRHFADNPDERLPYMAKARIRVFREYTYHHRLADTLAYIFDGETLSPHQPVIGDRKQVAE